MKKKTGSSTDSVYGIHHVDPHYRAVVPPLIYNAAFACNSVEEWLAHCSPFPS